MTSARDHEWAHAFATQARADYYAYNVLASSIGMAECQPLHFLQMLCEKLAKAHLYKTGSASTYTQGSHAYVAKVLPLVLRNAYEHAHRRRPQDWLFQDIRRLAREIELLAPAVDGGGSRPDNCEYPWEDKANRIHIPATYDFPTLNLATSPGGVEMMKLLPLAIDAALEDKLVTGRL